MAKLHTASYIEPTDALTKIMVAQTGASNVVFIRKSVSDEIISCLKRFGHETGGIIGVDENGEIIAFQFDNSVSTNPYEYSPNVDFLCDVINGSWVGNNVGFAGFVHSHLHNNVLSEQDVSYIRNILQENEELESLFVGVVNLQECEKGIRFYLVNSENVSELTGRFR